MNEQLVIIVEPKMVKAHKANSGDMVYSMNIVTDDKRLMAVSQLDADTLLKLTIEEAA